MVSASHYFLDQKEKKGDSFYLIQTAGFMKYHLKVSPRKDLGEAILNISFEGFAFDEARGFLENFAEKSKDAIVQLSLDSENFEIKIIYASQEYFVKNLEEGLREIPLMEKGSRSILIEKLGGWFDF